MYTFHYIISEGSRDIEYGTLTAGTFVQARAQLREIWGPDVVISIKLETPLCSK